MSTDREREALERMASEERIVHDWSLAVRLYRRGTRLGQKIALAIADALEADGVTEADIDRLFILERIVAEADRNPFNPMRATLTATLQPGRGAVGNFAGETAAIWRERLAAAQAALAERDAVLAEAREALMAHRETFIAAGAMPFDDDVLLGMTDAALARIDALKGETDV